MKLSEEIKGTIYLALTDPRRTDVARWAKEAAQLEEENEKLMKLLDRLYMAADDKIYEEVYLVLTPEGERIER